MTKNVTLKTPSITAITACRKNSAGTDANDSSPTMVRRINVTNVAAHDAEPALWMVDADGPNEVVEAEVIRTTRWKHVTAKGSHPHLRATILIDGSSEEVIEKADGYSAGDTIRVWIRRGRISGWPYFSDVVEAGDLESVIP